MFATSGLCNCDWPTFFVDSADLPLHGPFQVPEVLVGIPDHQRGRTVVQEDDGFASSNFIGCASRQRVREAVRMLGQDPAAFDCLRECA